MDYGYAVLGCSVIVGVCVGIACGPALGIASCVALYILAPLR